MKAVVMTEAGGPEVLALSDVQDPVPGAGEVLVEVAAAGVNFMDIGARRGMLGAPWLDPNILGVEGSGRVRASGAGVDLAPGQRVAWVFAPGSYAETIVMPAAALVPVPDEIDDRTAAAIMMQGLTASHFATDFYPVEPGDVALVHAAAGGLGGLLTQIIKLRGGTVIGRVSNADKVVISKEAGADHVIVDTDGHFADQALAFTNGAGVHVVYDGSGPTTFRDRSTLCGEAAPSAGTAPCSVGLAPSTS
jgi:NADPH2:quinone reductase